MKSKESNFYKIVKSSLGITIFLFSLYIVIKMLFFQKGFSFIIYFNSVINSISNGLFQSKSFYVLFIVVLLSLLLIYKIKKSKEL